jgi:hypothetical protein
MSNAYNFFKPAEIRPLGRPRGRREDEIKIDLNVGLQCEDVEWIKLVGILGREFFCPTHTGSVTT